MACVSITSLPRGCGSDSVMGGTDKLYMIAFADLAAVSGSTEVFSTGSNGVVDEIGLASAKTFVEVGLLKSTTGFSVEGTFNAQTGSNYVTNSFSVTLNDISATNTAWIESVRYQPVAAMLKSRTGKYFVVGLNGQMEISALTGGNGVVEDDLNGYVLTFSGVDGKLPRLVDPTIVVDLIS
jgi:hypothetical protein